MEEASVAGTQVLQKRVYGALKPLAGVGATYDVSMLGTQSLRVRHRTHKLGVDDREHLVENGTPLRGIQEGHATSLLS